MVAPCVDHTLTRGLKAYLSHGGSSGTADALADKLRALEPAERFI